MYGALHETWEIKVDQMENLANELQTSSVVLMELSPKPVVAF